MRISRTVVLAALTFSVLAGACGGGGDSDLAAFCELNNDPELEGLDPSDPDGAEQMTAAFTRMVETAPEEIKEDVETTRAGFEAVKSGNPADVADVDLEEFQAAGTRVQEYAEEHCT